MPKVVPDVKYLVVRQQIVGSCSNGNIITDVEYAKFPCLTDLKKELRKTLDEQIRIGVQRIKDRS